MKQIASVFFIALYTFFNIGLVVNTHSCGGKIVSVALFGKKAIECGSCRSNGSTGKTEVTKNCCQDSQTQLTLDDTQLKFPKSIDISKSLSLFKPVSNYFLIQLPGYTITKKYRDQFYVFETWPPKTPLYIRLHSLLI